MGTGAFWVGTGAFWLGTGAFWDDKLVHSGMSSLCILGCQAKLAWQAGVHRKKFAGNYFYKFSAEGGIGIGRMDEQEGDTQKEE